MSIIVYRRAFAEDLPDIIALLADDVLGSTREEAHCTPRPEYVSAFEAIQADPNQLLAVAEFEGEVIGCLQLSFIPGLTRKGMWRGQIEGVRIAKRRQGSGVGRGFFAWAIEQCRTRHCGLVQLTTDKTRHDAHSFYQALGFAATHEGMKLLL